MYTKILLCSRTDSRYVSSNVTQTREYNSKIASIAPQLVLNACELENSKGLSRWAPKN